MKKISLFVLALLLAIIFMSSSANAATNPTGNEFKITRHKPIELYSKDKMKPNGEFIISIRKGKKWIEISRIPCDRFSRDNMVEIKGTGKNQKTVTLMITKKGGGAAYIDSVSLNSKPALPIKTAKDPFLRKKISKKDLDVAGAHNRNYILEFPLSGRSKNILALTGRIEAKEISKHPFVYPVNNQLKNPKDYEDFYTYRLGSNKKSSLIDGKINELSGTKPFFREMSVPGSGHPKGFTYGWISNDSENLYVSIDFTPDNTYDGNLDYSKVLIKTDKGLKEFKVSVPDKKWGKPGFTYTDKVAYQHKTYEFKIPLREIGKKTGNIQVAFEAYGTAAVTGDLSPDMAYDSVNNRYFLVYTKEDGADNDIYGQFVNPDGTLLGSEFVIANDTNPENSPKVSYDPVTRRFLVVWAYSTTFYDIYGRIINDGGTFYTDSFPICNEATSHQLNPQVCYDNVNARFDVIWKDERGGGTSIYGQIVKSDGTLFGTASDVNFVVSNGGNSVIYPAVAFDSTNGRFMAVWSDFRNGNRDIYGQIMNADGTPFGTLTNVNFPVSNVLVTHQNDPEITFDPVNNRFLVVWTDSRNGNDDIYGQLVNADGSLFNTASDVNFVVSNNVNNQTDPCVAYYRALQRFLVIWDDTRGGVYGQYLQADGTAVGTTTDVNFLVATASSDDPAIAYNDSLANFLAGWALSTSPSTIGLATVGASNAPDISVDQSQINFGQIPINTNSNPVTITVTNNGTSPLYVGNLVKAGQNAAEFTIQNDNVSGQTINPAANATFQVVFSPVSAGSKLAQVTIPSNDPDEMNFIVSLYGNMTEPIPTPSASPTTSPTPTPTVSPTSSPTPTPTVSPTTTPTPTPSPTSTPTVPQLVSPENGSTTGSTDVNFQWNSSEDKGKGTISYQIYLGTKPDLSDAEVIDVPTTTTALPFQMAGFTVVFAGIILGAGRKRKDVKFYLLLIALGAMFVTFMVAGCGGSDGDSGGGDPGTTMVSHTVEGLNPATTYYWKIVSTNDQGASTSSDVWNFNTP